MTELDKLRRRVASLERELVKNSQLVGMIEDHEERLTECERCIDDMSDEVEVEEEIEETVEEEDSPDQSDEFEVNSESEVDAEKLCEID